MRTSIEYQIDCPFTQTTLLSEIGRYRRFLKQRLRFLWVARPVVITAAFSLVLFYTSYALPQSCPDSNTITTTNYGDLTVREGPVIAPDDPLNLGADAGVAIDAPDEDPPWFIVTWISNRKGEPNGGGSDHVLAAGFSAAGDSNGGTCLHAPTKVSTPVGNGWHTFNQLPSVAMTASSRVLIGFTAWSTAAGELRSENAGVIRFPSSFNFDDTNWPAAEEPVGAAGDFRPSVGVSDSQTPVNAVVHARTILTANGLAYSPEAGESVAGLLETCTLGVNCNTRVFQWNPSVSAHNTTGYWVAVWAHAENPGQEPPFDICLQLFKPDGTKAHTTPVVVNDKTSELQPSRQFLPSVDIDVNRNIVVCWWGLPLSGCVQSNYDRIYARRLKWNGSDSAPTFDGLPFIVSNDPGYRLAIIGESEFTPALFPNPCVSLSKSGDGRFLIVWNVEEAAGSLDAHEIHGQYFNGAMPMGREFRVNQENSQPLGSPSWQHRRVGNPGQHTVAYGPDMAVCAWSVIQSNDGEVSNGNERTYFTLLPPGFDEYQASQMTCCKGDMNGNGLVTLSDVPLVVEFLLTGSVMSLKCTSATELFCAADVNSDGFADGRDIGPFVEQVLQQATCAPVEREFIDCNSNEVIDADDIAKGTSQDCNGNFVPDECDLASETSADVNSNEIPDECEADCNGNSVPDGWDISQQTSNDVNSNGVPDECERDCNFNGVPDDWDISQQTSADCNANGEPDECEVECNGNGVPDDCDIDPSDPDGNQQVSPDCNANSLPDECDLAYGPPFGSLDCNGNGIPDECDIAACESDPACGDCNGNGIPDACDIESAISLDENQNGVPDECEEQMGGSQMQQMSSEEGPHPDPLPGGEGDLAAWEAFYEWCDAQCWGPNCSTSGAEQFQRYVDKLVELGLPVGG